MAVPARPTSGVPIETAWGQVAHDTAVAMDIQSGTGTTPTGSGELSGNLVVTFPRPFASAPIVVATAGNVHYAMSATATATQGTFASKRITQSTGAGTSFSWIAYGPRA
jgi:hypothetical protein